MMHKFHVSVSQVEFRQNDGTVEIVIRVFADDFENALSGHAKRPVRADQLQRDEKAGELVLSYLRSALELRTRAGQPVRLNWDGMEGQTDVFWLYLKGRAPGGIEGAQMKNRIFCELFDDQVNIVNTRFGGKQVGTMFERTDGFKPITKKM
ncbi:MAG: hypothetical protein IPM66_02555 [Acidobacteriota bacterium]|nr:MAG: hypothetical protein IPM66_02555 [Acidobacteriota bacterium]